MNIQRRRFLQSAAATVAYGALGAYGLDLIAGKPRRVGIIGCGWYGKNDLFRLMQVAPVEVVSVCDVDKNMREGAADTIAQRQKSKSRPRLFGDYREMLREKDLDIVVIGTPDHWHALVGIAAMEAGADVYLQKPISVDVIEGEALLATARKLGRVVQIGTQRRSTPHLIDAKKQVVDAGLLGKIGHVDMCCYYHMRANGNPPEEKVPDFLDYELWSGPAPLRPYDGLPHKRWWRTFMEYGNGIVGDMCVHMFDTARWMLDLGWPRRISSSGGIFVQKDGKSNISDTQSAVFEYDTFQCNWEHRTWGAPVDPEFPWAVFIHGEKGTFKASTQRAVFIPLDKTQKTLTFENVMEEGRFPEEAKEDGFDGPSAVPIRRHMLDFLAAIDQRGRPAADIEQGHISTASCIIANMAMKLGRPLSYDAKARTIPGDDGATALLRRKYRGPWTHPDV